MFYLYGTLPGAFERWILAQPDRSAVTRQCEALAGLGDETQQQHKECELSHMKQHTRAVLKLTSTIDNMVNPFSSDMEGLVSISSGMVANPDVSRDLTTAHEQGKVWTLCDDRFPRRDLDWTMCGVRCIYYQLNTVAIITRRTWCYR